jgi:hypothetical protein
VKINIAPINPQALYESHRYDDDKAGTIVEKLPVSLVDGQLLPDHSRQAIYIGETYINQHLLSLRIEASTLTEAIQKFHVVFEDCIESQFVEARKAQIANAAKNLPPGLILGDRPKR